MGDAFECLGPNCSSLVVKSRCDAQFDGKYFCSTQCMEEYKTRFAERTGQASSVSSSDLNIGVSIICIVCFLWLICPHDIVIKYLSSAEHPPAAPGKDERFAGAFLISMLLVGVGTFFVKTPGIRQWTKRSTIFIWFAMLAGLKVGIYIFMGWFGAI